MVAEKKSNAKGQSGRENQRVKHIRKIEQKNTMIEIHIQKHIGKQIQKRAEKRDMMM